MSEAELPLTELHEFLEAERLAPPVDLTTRASLRARLSASIGDASATRAQIRDANDRELGDVHATAREPLAAPPWSGVEKGKMNILDKRIIGAATVIAAAVALIAITVYKRHSGETSSRSRESEVSSRQRVDTQAPPPGLRADLSIYRDGPAVDLGRTFVTTPHFPPVAPKTRADVAITAGESAWIHVPFGTVDVEIQSDCDAKVEMAVVASIRVNPGTRVGDRPTLSTETGRLVGGIDGPNARTITFQLAPGLDRGEGMYEYTSTCIGAPRPPVRGNLVVDRVDPSDPSESFTNARVYHNVMTLQKQGIHVFGTVLPGAKVWLGADRLALKPGDPARGELPIYSAFATNVMGALQHLVAAVRVDDVMGTHFYVIRSSGLVEREQCANAMAAPKQTAETLDAQGDHAGALSAIEAGMAVCRPDVEVLSLALSYACKAADVAAARKYWHRVSSDVQRASEPTCVKHGVTRNVLETP